MLEPLPSDSRRKESDCTFSCRLLCCKCSFFYRVATKERCKSQLLLQPYRNKIYERCFLCRSLEFCKSCHKCPNCCYRSTCRGKATQFLGEMGSSGFESKSSRHTQRGLDTSLPVQTKLNQVTNCHKQLSQPIKTGPPFRGTVSAGEQKCSRTDSKPKLTRVLQPAIFGTQTQQLVETYLGPEQLEHLSKHRVVQNGDPGDYQNLPTVRGVGHIHRLPYTYSQSRNYMHFHLQGRSYQFKALPFGLSTAPIEFTVVAKEIKLMALQRGIRIHQYLDDWLVRATSHQTCLQHALTLVALCRELGWLVNKEKSELEPKQVFNFVGYQARSDPHQSVGKPSQTRYCQQKSKSI